MKQGYPNAYYEGVAANIDNRRVDQCPYSSIPAPDGSNQRQRENSEMCLRHWWIAGRYDAKED